MFAEIIPPGFGTICRYQDIECKQVTNGPLEILSQASGHLNSVYITGIRLKRRHCTNPGHLAHQNHCPSLCCIVKGIQPLIAYSKGNGWIVTIQCEGRYHGMVIHILDGQLSYFNRIPILPVVKDFSGEEITNTDGTTVKVSDYVRNPDFKKPYKWIIFTIFSVY
ncbi:hypothetical protein TNCV_1281871 [Trichonephila clavipes]|uniref:Uncharacterized protein n=1 Tax=Trichonephila clavipes TaxID=2585209 RepID=A0A8X6SKS2_TRICX|nr:hypothetical protein TNCV_1281871 [Trichonephila clavipes]